MGDDYDNYEDEDTSQTNGNEINPVPDEPIASLVPYFEQNEFRLHESPGTDVLINCDVRNFQSNIH